MVKYTLLVSLFCFWSGTESQLQVQVHYKNYFTTQYLKKKNTLIFYYSLMVFVLPYM